MSAVGGILHLDGRPVDPGALERMGHLLDAYGPDRGRAWREGDAALLHRLRRITPEDARDRQPLTGGEGRWVVSADVRLDNREELTRRLGLSRAWAPRLSDAALLVHAWEQWEEAAPERLLGDFAFAVWDRRERRLHLVRDPSGRRPLYWHRRGGLIAFASVPKGLFALPEIPRGIDEQRFAEYLALMPPFDEGSLLEGVQRVLPAHRLELDERGEANHRYHRFDPERRIVYRREEEYVEHARELLDEAVRCRLRAEGPIAAHLSSGLDSASVTATAARLLGERELLAYTAVPRPGFDGPVPRGRHADEGPGAAAVAARFTNIRHIRLSTEGASPLDQLAESTEGYGLGAAVRTPTNHLWADAIFKDAADRGARVLLTGIAGNKTLSYHGRHRLAGLVGSGELLRWVREAAALRRSGEMRWPRLLATSFGPWLPRGWIRRAVELGGEKSFALLENSPIHPELLRRTGVVKKIGHTGFGLGHHLNSDGRGRRLALFSNRGGVGPFPLHRRGLRHREARPPGGSAADRVLPGDTGRAVLERGGIPPADEADDGRRAARGDPLPRHLGPAGGGLVRGAARLPRAGRRRPGAAGGLPRGTAAAGRGGAATTAGAVARGGVGEAPHPAGLPEQAAARPLRRRAAVAHLPRQPVEYPFDSTIILPRGTRTQGNRSG